LRYLVLLHLARIRFVYSVRSAFAVTFVTPARSTPRSRRFCTVLRTVYRLFTLHAFYAICSFSRSCVLRLPRYVAFVYVYVGVPVTFPGFVTCSTHTVAPFGLFSLFLHFVLYVLRLLLVIYTVSRSLPFTVPLPFRLPRSLFVSFVRWVHTTSRSLPLRSCVSSPAFVLPPHVVAAYRLHRCRSFTFGSFCYGLVTSRSLLRNRCYVCSFPALRCVLHVLRCFCCSVYVPFLILFFVTLLPRVCSAPFVLAFRLLFVYTHHYYVFHLLRSCFVIHWPGLRFDRCHTVTLLPHRFVSSTFITFYVRFVHVLLLTSSPFVPVLLFVRSFRCSSFTTVRLRRAFTFVLTFTCCSFVPFRFICCSRACLRSFHVPSFHLHFLHSLFSSFLRLPVHIYVSFCVFYLSRGYITVATVVSFVDTTFLVFSAFTTHSSARSHFVRLPFWFTFVTFVLPAFVCYGHCLPTFVGCVLRSFSTCVCCVHVLCLTSASSSFLVLVSFTLWFSLRSFAVGYRSFRLRYVRLRSFTSACFTHHCYVIFVYVCVDCTTFYTTVIPFVLRVTCYAFHVTGLRSVTVAVLRYVCGSYVCRSLRTLPLVTPAFTFCVHVRSRVHSTVCYVRSRVRLVLRSLPVPLRCSFATRCRCVTSRCRLFVTASPRCVTFHVHLIYVRSTRSAFTLRSFTFSFAAVTFVSTVPRALGSRYVYYHLPPVAFTGLFTVRSRSIPFTVPVVPVCPPFTFSLRYLVAVVVWLRSQFVLPRSLRLPFVAFLLPLPRVVYVHCTLRSLRLPHVCLPSPRFAVFVSRSAVVALRHRVLRSFSLRCSFTLRCRFRVRYLVGTLRLLLPAPLPRCRFAHACTFYLFIVCRSSRSVVPRSSDFTLHLPRCSLRVAVTRVVMLLCRVCVRCLHGRWSAPTVCYTVAFVCLLPRSPFAVVSHAFRVCATSLRWCVFVCTVTFTSFVAPAVHGFLVLSRARYPRFTFCFACCLRSAFVHTFSFRAHVWLLPRLRRLFVTYVPLPVHHRCLCVLLPLPFRCTFVTRLRAYVACVLRFVRSRLGLSFSSTVYVLCCRSFVPLRYTVRFTLGCYVLTFVCLLPLRYVCVPLLEFRFTRLCSVAFSFSVYRSFLVPRYRSRCVCRSALLHRCCVYYHVCRFVTFTRFTFLRVAFVQVTFAPFLVFVTPARTFVRSRCYLDSFTWFTFPRCVVLHSFALPRRTTPPFVAGLPFSFTLPLSLRFTFCCCRSIRTRFDAFLFYQVLRSHRTRCLVPYRLVTVFLVSSFAICRSLPARSSALSFTLRLRDLRSTCLFTCRLRHRLVVRSFWFSFLRCLLPHALFTVALRCYVLRFRSPCCVGLVVLVPFPLTTFTLFTFGRFPLLRYVHRAFSFTAFVLFSARTFHTVVYLALLLYTTFSRCCTFVVVRGPRSSRSFSRSFTFCVRSLPRYLTVVTLLPRYVSPPTLHVPGRLSFVLRSVHVTFVCLRRSVHLFYSTFAWLLRLIVHVYARLRYLFAFTFTYVTFVATFCVVAAYVRCSGFTRLIYVLLPAFRLTRLRTLPHTLVVLRSWCVCCVRVGYWSRYPRSHAYFCVCLFVRLLRLRSFALCSFRLVALRYLSRFAWFSFISFDLFPLFTTFTLFVRYLRFHHFVAHVLLRCVVCSSFCSRV